MKFKLKALGTIKDNTLNNKYKVSYKGSNKELGMYLQTLNMHLVNSLIDNDIKTKTRFLKMLGIALISEAVDDKEYIEKLKQELLPIEEPTFKSNGILEELELKNRLLKEMNKKGE